MLLTSAERLRCHLNNMVYASYAQSDSRVQSLKHYAHHPPLQNSVCALFSRLFSCSRQRFFPSWIWEWISSVSYVANTRVAISILPWSGKISEGPTATFGGPSNSETQSIVSGGARSALGRPLYPAETPSRGSAAEGSDIEGSTARTEPRGKWPLGRPRHAKGVS